MASKKRIGRPARRRFTPDRRRGPGHQVHQRGSSSRPGSAPADVPAFEAEPAGTRRVTRVPFTPHPDLDTDARADLRDLINNYLDAAGLHRGNAFVRGGVIYLQHHDLLRRFEPMFRQMGSLAGPVEIDVPEAFA